jgi:hypothetical protein
VTGAAERLSSGAAGGLTSGATVRMLPGAPAAPCMGRSNKEGGRGGGTERARETG